MFIIFLFISIVFVFFNFRQPNLSSYDRQISVLSCIKYNNTCEQQDLISIRKMCFIFLKGSNIFPKETSSSDIVNVCNRQFQNMLPHIRNIYVNYYDEKTVNILENKFNIMKFIDEKYPELR